MKAQRRTIRLDDASIEKLKARYDPELVDAVLTRIEEIDVEAVYEHALDEIVKMGLAPLSFDKQALERRKHETAIIKEEVVIFREMGRLMASINERYRSLTGLDDPENNQEEEPSSDGAGASVPTSIPRATNKEG